MRVLRNALEDATERRVTLEEQLNDLSELHRNEIINIKHVRASDVTTQEHTPAKSRLLMYLCDYLQELQSMEEKMQYQLEERTKDLQEQIESCNSKVSIIVSHYYYSTNNMLR